MKKRLLASLLSATISYSDLILIGQLIVAVLNLFVHIYKVL